MTPELGKQNPAPREHWLARIHVITNNVLNDTIDRTPTEERNPSLHAWRGARNGNDSGIEIHRLIKELRKGPNGESNILEEIDEIIYGVVYAALEWVYDNVSMNAEVKRLDIAAIVTNSMLHRVEISLKPDYAKKKFHDEIAEGIYGFFEGKYESIEPKDIFKNILQQSWGDNELLHEYLVKYSGIQRFLSELNTLDPGRRALIWSTKCAMTCSLDNPTDLEEFDIRHTSCLYRQAAEWILKGGPDIAATCHCGANLGAIYVLHPEKELKETKSPGLDYFSALRWKSWKTALQEVISKYEAHTQRLEHKYDVRPENRGQPEWNAGKRLEETLEACRKALERMQALDGQRQNVRCMITRLLLASVSISTKRHESRREKAIDDLIGIIGIWANDPVYSNEYFQAHVLERLSQERYIWVCAVERLFDWEPPDLPGRDRSGALDELFRGIPDLLYDSILQSVPPGTDGQNMMNILHIIIQKFFDRVNMEDKRPETEIDRLRANALCSGQIYWYD